MNYTKVNSVSSKSNNEEMDRIENQYYIISFSADTRPTKPVMPVRVREIEREDDKRNISNITIQTTAVKDFGT